MKGVSLWDLRADSGASAAPVYARIALQLERWIRYGRVSPGDSIPPENELARHLGVSRGTIRKSLSVLAEQGLIQRQRGRGTRVTPQFLEQQLAHVTSFGDEMRSQGLMPLTELLSLELGVPPPRVQKMLGDGYGKAWKIERRRSVDGLPIAVEVAHVPSNLLDYDAVKRAGKASIYQTFRENGFEIAEVEQVIESSRLDTRTAILLSLQRGAPCFKLTRVTICEAGRVLEVVESRYRGDVYRLRVRLTA